MKQALLFLITLFVFSCSDNMDIIPSGKIIKESRPISDFTSIILSNGISLTLSQDETDVIMIEADDNIINYIETYTKGKTLYIQIKEGINIDSYKRIKTVKVRVSTMILEHLSVSGGSPVKFLPPFNLDYLDISASGGSSIDGNLILNRLTYSLSGGGKVCLTGSCKELNISSSGGSENHLYDFKSDYVEIEVSGGSLAELLINKELTVKSATGGSKIYYKGDAEVTVTDADNSSIIFRK